ncbi:hypothetical protein MRX96_031555 [Rhipicephalus microplus]
MYTAQRVLPGQQSRQPPTDARCERSPVDGCRARWAAGGAWSSRRCTEKPCAEAAWCSGPMEALWPTVAAQRQGSPARFRLTAGHEGGACSGAAGITAPPWPGCGLGALWHRASPFHGPPVTQPLKESFCGAKAPPHPAVSSRSGRSRAVP